MNWMHRRDAGSRSSRRSAAVAVAVTCALACAALLVAAAPALGKAKTKLVSVSSSGARGNQGSVRPSISAGGRRVAFHSFATNLVRGDTNGVVDVFVRNLNTGRTRRVSVSSSGAQANGASDFGASISANGRRVAFTSKASNLVAGDTNGVDDVFVHNLKTGTTRRVSVSSTGAQANGRSGDYNSISADGHLVAFNSAATNLAAGDAPAMFVHDLLTGETRRVNAGRDPSISADGRRIAFVSSGDGVFVRSLRTGRTRRVSVSSRGVSANRGCFDPSISADGRRVAFYSRASNLVRRDDPDPVHQVFVHNLRTGKTKLVSVSSRGRPGNHHSVTPSISADGRFVAFDSAARNLVRRQRGDGTDGTIFVHDLRRRKTRLVARACGAGGCWPNDDPSISADGRFVAFDGPAQVFRRGPLRWR